MNFNLPCSQSGLAVAFGLALLSGLHGRPALTQAQESVKSKPNPAAAPLRASWPPVTWPQFVTLTLDARGNLISHQIKTADTFTENLGNGVTLEMVRIPGGSFTMGAPASEAGGNDLERPRHQVRVGSFALGRVEVTRAQWRAVASFPKVARDLPEDPASFKDSWQQPVESVTWDEAVEFCARLSRQSGRAYRLPSEAEWEYAARAGAETPFAFGATITPELVNYDGGYPYDGALSGQRREKTVAVGSLGVANAFGLYDMHGNVYEWCQDIWHGNYEGAPTDGSAWLTGGDARYRVLRGGSWDLMAKLCRSAYRLSYTPGFRIFDFGLRVASVAKGP